MVETAGITIRVFVTFSDCKESNVTKPPRQRMWGLNFSHAVIIEIRVKKCVVKKATIIESSKAKQSTVNN